MKQDMQEVWTCSWNRKQENDGKGERTGPTGRRCPERESL